jgi:hypothetical protein
LAIEDTGHILWTCPSAMDVQGNVEKSSKKVIAMAKILCLAEIENNLNFL